MRTQFCLMASMPFVKVVKQCRDGVYVYVFAYGAVIYVSCATGLLLQLAFVIKRGLCKKEKLYKWNALFQYILAGT